MNYNDYTKEQLIDRMKILEEELWHHRQRLLKDQGLPYEELRQSR